MSFKKAIAIESAENEVEIHNVAAKYGFAPKINKIIKGDSTWTIFMENLGENSLAHIYGDDPADIPEWIWDSMRTMVTTLFEEEGIEYIDITPYNFIEVDEKLWMIDYGDAKWAETGVETNWFLEEFMAGENAWNSDFT